jgi:hypothetical protein
MKYSRAKLDDIEVDSSVEVEKIIDAGLLVLLYILANRSRDERMTSSHNVEFAWLKPLQIREGRDRGHPEPRQGLRPLHPIDEWLSERLVPCNGSQHDD